MDRKDDDVYIYLEKEFKFSEEEIDRLYDKNPYFTRVLDVDVAERVSYFNSLGFSNNELKTVIADDPHILVYSLNRLKKIENDYKQRGINKEDYKKILLDNIRILDLDRKES